MVRSSAASSLKSLRSATATRLSTLVATVAPSRLRSSRNIGREEGLVASFRNKSQHTKNDAIGICAVVAAGAVISTSAVAFADGPSSLDQQPVKSSKTELDAKQIAQIPSPGLQSIGDVSFTPDGRHVVYLRSAEYGNLSRQLYATEVSSGKTVSLAGAPSGSDENLSQEEKLRRERARIMNTGVTSFKLSGTAGSEGRLLVPLGGELYIRDGVATEAPPLRKVFDAKAALGPDPILDPQMSDDGSLICFVWNDELYCVQADGSSPPRQLTTGARGTGKKHGLADFNAQEELDRYEGFWISPCGKMVVYQDFDEAHMAEFRIMHSGSESVGENAQENHRYPFAGEANPKVRLFVVPTDQAANLGDAPKPVELLLTKPFGEDFYLGRVKWMPDGKILVQIINREQTELALLKFDPATGRSCVLLKERTDVWINITDMLKPMGKTGKFLWPSERSGFMHLYVYSEEDGGNLKQITAGDWGVDSVVGVDEEAGKVYYTSAGAANCLESHLWSVSIDGGDSVRLTQAPGFHRVIMDPKCKTFVDVSSSVDKPANATLRSIDGKILNTIFANDDPRIKELGLDPPEFFTFPSTDGKVQLQGALYKPDASKYGPGPYPTIVSCYGGPHVQFVTNTWSQTADLRAQMKRSNGCLVLKVDNRGGSRRGLAFEGALKHDMGNVEVADQVAGVRWCIEQGLTDPARVGIYGWSYGGYLSAMCLARAPDVFKCAVSGAPVTHWDGYDSCYTERYMGTPKSNPEGYKRSSVMEYAAAIKGDLLLVHGLIDENVHFRHTARLISKLIDTQTPYQLQLFPSERHSPRSAKDREFMEERIWAFFSQSLRLGKPYIE